MYANGLLSADNAPLQHIFRAIPFILQRYKKKRTSESMQTQKILPSPGGFFFYASIKISLYIS